VWFSHLLPVWFVVRRAWQIFHLLLPLVRGAGEEDSGFGAGDGDRFFPVEAGQEIVGARDLGLADEKGETALWGQEGCGREQDMVEALDGTQGHEGGGGRREVFGAAGEYIDVRQCKCADGFAQEGYFFVVRFDQGDPRVRRPDFHGQAGEAGTGAEIDYQRSRGGWEHFVRGCRTGKQLAGGEEGLPEMPGDDFFRGADGGEIDPGIPAEQ